MEEALYHALNFPPKFSPLTIDGTAKVMIAGVMGDFPGLNPKTDYDDVEMLIYVGTNPMVSHVHNTGMFQPADFIRAAAARGEVWTIDPVRTETADWSTRHIAAYPGKDYAVLAWLTRETFELPVMDSWSPGSNIRPDVLGDWPCAVPPLEIEAGNVRALMNFGGSLLRSFPDTNALTAALKKLELNVITEIIANETTELCTHVLPTKGAVERAEIQRWDSLAWNVSMQFTPPLVKPIGEGRSAWWVISQIMRRANRT